MTTCHFVLYIDSMAPVKLMKSKISYYLQ